MALWLKQSTAVDVALGPFVSSTDGFTPQTALSLTSAETRLKKNNGLWAARTDVTTGTHEEEGWYEIELDATDTGTLGHLTIAVYIAGALPVWQEYMVLPAVVYDALVAGTDNLDINVAQWLGTAAATPTVAGVLEVDLTHIAGAVVSTTSAQIGVNTVSTSAAAITSASIATDAIDDDAIATGAIASTAFAAGAINAAAIAADAITDAKVAADVTIASVTGAVGSVTGSVGSVTGAVGSVTGAVGSIGAGGIASTSFAAGAINAAAIAADAIGASELAADAVSEIVTGVLAGTVTELGAIPAASPTVAQALAILYMALRNVGVADTNADTLVIKNDAGTIIATAPTTDAGGVFTKGKYV